MIGFNRRRFLQLTGIGLGAGVLGFGGVLAHIQPQRRRWPAVEPDDASRPLAGQPGRRVVVVGGGLAGLVTAIELANRHFSVTLLERAPDLGGKVGGWNVRGAGEEFPIEHGFHGFFSQYYNLREVLAGAAATGDFGDSPGYPVLFGDRPGEVFGKTTKIFPLNLLSVVRQSHSLHMMDFKDDGDGLYELLRYDPVRTFAKLDGVDFATFAREGRINRPMVETVLAPFGKTTLNRIERLSAAEALRFFHFYFMGNPEGLGFHLLKRDSMTAIVHPLRRRLEALGGVVRAGTQARRLVAEGGRVTAVVVDGTPAPPPTVLVGPEQVPATGFLALPQEDGSSIFVGQRAGQLVAYDGRCTHMGCPVRWDASTWRFQCPCHGGAFDPDGSAVAGPPKAPLVRLEVLPGPSGKVAIGAARTGPKEEALPCDYCVVACEVRGLKQLVEASALPVPEWTGRVRALGEADPYVVWRLWLDKPTQAGRNPFYTVSRYRYTDSLAIYSAFQEPFIAWARKTGGSVVEVHAYAIAPEAMVPAEELRRVMRQEMEAMLPELKGARVLHEEYQQQSNFSRWAPGDAASRPSTETPIANLMLAGDHVALPMPAALMEAAAISGRLAASAVLRRERLREVEVQTVALKGPLA